MIRISSDLQTSLLIQSRGELGFLSFKEITKITLIHILPEYQGFPNYNFITLYPMF